MPPGFFVVQTEMLHTSCHTIALHPFDVRNNHLRRKVGILSHIFEVAPVQRGPVNIDTGSEQHVLLPEARLFSDGLAVESGHFRVPGGGKASQGREGNDGVVCPTRLGPFVPQNFRADPVGTVRAPKLRNTEARDTGRRELGLGMQDLDFFFQCHTRESIIDTRFQVRMPILVHRAVERSLPRSLPSAGNRQCKRDEK